MSDLENMAAQLAHFLKLHNINSSNVKVILRAKDDETFGRMERAIRLDLEFLKSQEKPANSRRFKLHGIHVALGTLDYSR